MVKFNSKEGIKLEPKSAAPTVAKGVMYYDSDDDKIKISVDGTTFDNILNDTDVGTGANQLVQLNSSSQLPAVDGSLLTGISGGGELGTIIMHNPTVSGSKSIAQMQALGWAVCDGTTPAAQGISSPDIATTPNMVGRFPQGHATVAETTGGTSSHTHPSGGSPNYASSGSSVYYAAASHIPPFLTVVFMMKVKE